MKPLKEALIKKHSSPVPAKAYIPSFSDMENLMDKLQIILADLTYYQSLDISTQKMKNPADFMKKWGELYRPKDIYVYLDNEGLPYPDPGVVRVKYTLNGDASNRELADFFVDALNNAVDKNKHIFDPIFHPGYPHDVFFEIVRRDGKPGTLLPISIVGKKFKHTL